MNHLEEFFSQHRGKRLDKYVHYLEVYDKYLHKYRNKKVTILEIGVNHGGSIDMWRSYFGEQCRYIGVDINPKCKEFESDGIEIYIGDQGDRDFLRSLADSVGHFDILIDDGGHSMVQQWTTFEVLYPRISVPGAYICEDTHTSYLPAFGGSRKSSNTFMNQILQKRILTEWHYEPVDKMDEFARTTESMHFFHSVVVIEKKFMSPVIGLTAGELELSAPPPQVTGERFLRNKPKLLGFIRNHPKLYQFMLRVRDKLRKRA